MRKSNIPPGGSIPRAFIQRQNARQQYHHTSFESDVAWKPHVIERKPQQKQSPLSHADNKLKRKVFEQLLAQVQQEFTDLCTMAREEGKTFDIGFAPYISLLEKRMVDISTEIKNL